MGGILRSLGAIFGKREAKYSVMALEKFSETKVNELRWKNVNKSKKQGIIINDVKCNTNLN